MRLGYFLFNLKSVKRGCRRFLSHLHMCPLFSRHPGLVPTLCLRNIKAQNYNCFVALVTKQNIVVLSTTSFQEIAARGEKKEKKKLWIFSTHTLELVLDPCPKGLSQRGGQSNQREAQGIIGCLGLRKIREMSQNKDGLPFFRASAWRCFLEMGWVKGLEEPSKSTPPPTVTEN